MESVSDIDLLRRWQDGDSEAGEQLFTRYFELVWRFFSRRGVPNIEDLVQSTFLGCLEAAERFREESSFSTYLYSIARNQLFANNRKRLAYQSRLLPLHSSFSDNRPSPSSVARRKVERNAISEAFESLPEELQTVLEFYYWEGIKAAEIATILEIPLGTVRSRIRRSLSALRDGIAQQLGDESEIDATFLRCLGRNSEV